ncbi:MAG: PEPxxWA-CTERM sorting domain-containing protein [Pontixanthobacter sp.]
MTRFQSIASSVAFLAAAFATPATAAEIVFTSTGSQSGAGQVFSDGATNVRVSSWSISNGMIGNAPLNIWSQGAGILNGRRGDSHTIDNGGSLDFLVLQFDRMVRLTDAEFRTGFHNMNDTDATIGYANTATNFLRQPALNGASLVSLRAIGNLYASNSANGNSIRNVNPDGYTANTWLIGASFDNPDTHRDGFKLRSVAFDTVDVTAPVPEPATWALMLLGFAAIGGAMRSGKAKGTTTVAYT